MEKLKEAYEPPEIQRVKLVRDELAVAACKTASSSGGPATGCLRGVAGPCRTAGS
jgi:hypothetical protein